MYNFYLIGRHTFDILAQAIQSVIDDYELGSKHLTVVTDNGSNFVKAFKMFPPRDADSDPEANSDDDEGSYIKMFLLKYFSSTFLSFLNLNSFR